MAVSGPEISPVGIPVTKVLPVTEEQYERCFQEIEDRCSDIRTPVVTVGCPCFNQEDLLAVTSDNVDDHNCPYSLSSDQGDTFKIGPTFGDNFCLREEIGSGSREDITSAERGVCGDLLLNRCIELGLDFGPPPPPPSPPTPPPSCPCFNEEDLLVVTSENVDEEGTNCNPWADPSSTKLSSVDGALFESGFDPTSFCLQEQNGEGSRFEDITGPERGRCDELVWNRCTELGIPTGN